MAQVFTAPLTTSDQSIDRVLAAGVPVLLVFLDRDTPASLEEAMNRLARENAGKLLVVKVRAPDSPATVRRFGITATPALALVRDGQALAQAERVTAADLNAHAAFLLGQGPRPEPPRPPEPAPSRPQAEQAGAGTPPRGATGGPAGDGQPVTVTDQTFDAMVLGSPQPVLVDFWAPWCGPCRMVGPIVDKLARENPGRLRVAKVNLDENPGLQQRYRIMSIPSMMVVQGGRIVDQWVGALPEPAIRSRVTPYIK